MPKTRNVAIFVGSLRKDSFNKRIAKAFTTLTPSSLSCELVEIGGLPLYNSDLDNDTPPGAWTAFRQRVKATDAVLFITPEYNRSIPAALKNALDVGSRPSGQSVWNGKPGAVISTSPGAMGGFGANHHLRQSLVFLNVPAMQQPEAYLGNIDKAFDNAGNLTAERTLEFLQKFAEAFHAWIEANIKH